MPTTSKIMSNNANYHLRILQVPRSLIADIEEIVNVPWMNSRGIHNWEVLDGSLPGEGLYLLHHTEGSDINEAGFIRGLLVDVENKLIVRRSFGREPNLELAEIPEEGPIVLKGNRGTTYEIGSRSVAVWGVDGVLLTVSLIKGKVRLGTHMQTDISVTKSGKGGTKTTYKEMLADLGGINATELFDFKKQHSPHVHYFMLAHPELMVSSKMPLEYMGIYYLGSRRMWGVPKPDEVPEDVELLSDNFVKTSFSPTMIDDTLSYPQGIVTPGTERKASQYFNIPVLTRPEINNFLKYGFYDVEDDGEIAISQLPGEYIFYYQYNDQGQIDKAIRIDSPSKKWRHDVLHPEGGYDSNMDHRFHSLIDTALGSRTVATLSKTGTGIINYREQLVDVVFGSQSEYNTEKTVYNRSVIANFPSVGYEEIQKRIANGEAIYYTGEFGEELPQDDVAGRIHNLWLNFIYAAPVSLQPQAFELYTKHTEAVLILTWYALFYQNDLEGLKKGGFGFMVSFLRFIQNERKIDSADEEKMYEDMQGSLYELDGRMMYSTISTSRRSYQELVVDRTRWLLKSLGTLISRKETIEWVRDHMQKEKRSKSDIERITKGFEETLDGLENAGLNPKHEFFDMQIRMWALTLVASKGISTFIQYTEFLDTIYEHGVEKIADLYKEKVTPDFLRKLSASDPTIYALFVEVQQVIEEGLEHKGLGIGEMTAEKPSAALIESIHQALYYQEVRDTTMVQESLVEGMSV